MSQLPAILMTTKKFDFGLFHNALEKADQINFIIENELDLHIVAEETKKIINFDYSKFSYLYFLSDDPLLKQLLLNCNFKSHNIIRVI